MLDTKDAVTGFVVVFWTVVVAIVAVAVVEAVDVIWIVVVLDAEVDIQGDSQFLRYLTPHFSLDWVDQS